MNTPVTQRTVRLWADWELLHIGGQSYELLRLTGKAWLHQSTFNANNDTAALEEAKALVALADRKPSIT